MSVWKKASKSYQKTHRERHQPEERSHLGLLEKKKDYLRRARDFNEKKETLKLLRKRALNKNPDEFYHHMVNSKIDDGKHFDKETEEEDTPDQMRLMRTQDLKYITTKRTQEMRKIEKLQAELHLTSINLEPKNKHIYFTKNIDKSEWKKKEFELLSQKELPDVDLEEIAEGAKKKKNLYSILSKRINRERELSTIQQKLEIKRHLESGKNVLPPKKVKKGSKTHPPIYVWKYERKK